MKICCSSELDMKEANFYRLQNTTITRSVELLQELPVLFCRMILQIEHIPLMI